MQSSYRERNKYFYISVSLLSISESSFFNSSYCSFDKLMPFLPGFIFPSFWKTLMKFKSIVGKIDN